MLAGGMDMKKYRSETAARFRAAVLFLLIGCLLPPLLPHGGMRLPSNIEALLSETLEAETAPERVAFVRTACALTGQVDYFWGGKSHTLGWDRAWGWPQRVTAPGSDTTGRVRPYGLDCSGLVSWAAATALKDPDAYDRIGWGKSAICPLPSHTGAPSRRPGLFSGSFPCGNRGGERQRGATVGSPLLFLSGWGGGYPCQFWICTVWYPFLPQKVCMISLLTKKFLYRILSTVERLRPQLIVVVSFFEGQNEGGHYVGTDTRREQDGRYAGG